MKPRIASIDIAKGLLIFLVVLGHSPISNGLNATINSFHMAAFFCLSGLTFSYKGQLLAFIKKKSVSIIIPYFVFSVLLIMFHWAKTALHLGGGNFNSSTDFESIFIPISGRPTLSVYGIWFLPCLFLTETIIALEHKIRQYNKLCSISFLFGICAILFSIDHLAQATSICSITPIGCLFVYIGIIGKPYLSKIQQYKYSIATTAWGLFAVGAYFHLAVYQQSVDLSSMTLGIWPIYLFCSFCGTIATIAISCIGKNKYIQSIGQKSLYIYGLHYLVIGMVEKFASGVICTLITLIICLTIIYIYERFKYRFLSFHTK